MTPPVVDEDLSARVLAVLREHLSPLSAALVLRRVKERASTSERLHERDLAAIAREIGPALSFYLPPDQRAPIMRAVLALAAGPRRSSIRVAIERERDVSTARLAARELATEHGAGTLVAQKIATIVSELARNIAGYAGHGAVELTVEAGPPRMMLIVAVDNGPGIADVDLILSGRYTSKTGLGKGLLGIRAMSSRFSVVSGGAGTRVEAAMPL